MTDRLTAQNGATIDPHGFTRWVAEYPKGQLDLELSEALADCVNATQLHGKKSTLTLTVTLTPGGGYYGELEVAAAVASKPAQPTAPVATFFPTVDGSLSRSHPDQPQLFDKG